ncbi:hypothetical protein FACS18945_3240 [Bacteroidia bacterium]|nr:hypothetical protein FACS18945_3240 [Bacteroidia bacterium]
MKKVFSAFVFICSFAFAQGEEAYLSSVKVENFDAETLIEYFYTPSGQPSIQLEKQKSGEAYINNIYTCWLYNEDKCLAEIRKTWQEDKYINHSRIDFEYFNDDIIAKTLKTWNSGAWENLAQESNTFGNTTVSIQKTWQNGAWLNQTKTELEYAGGNISKITLSLFANNQWTNDRKIEISANEEILYSWNGTTWVADEKTLYYRNASQLVELQEKQKWDNNAWEKKQRTEYKYNAAGKILSQEIAVWNNHWQNDLKIEYAPNARNYYSWEYNMWVPAFADTYTYDSENRQTAVETEQLFWGGGENFAKHLPLFVKNEDYARVFYGNRAETAYQPLSELIQEPDTDEEIINTTKLVIYPNPSFDGRYYINATNMRINACAAYSIDGKTVKTFGGNSNMIDMRDCKSGLYILKINTDKGNYKEKILLIF